MDPTLILHSIHKLINDGHGSRRMRTEFFRMFVGKNMTCKVQGYSLLEFLICYGADDDFPLVDHVVHLDCVSDYRSLLNFIYSDKSLWCERRRDLVRLLVSNGVYRVIDGKCNHILNRDTIFLHAHGIQNNGSFLRTIEKTEQQNGYRFPTRAPWRLVRLLLRCGLLPKDEYKNHLPTGIALSMGINDVIIRTDGDAIDHFRRGVYRVDELGMQIEKPLTSAGIRNYTLLFDERPADEGNESIPEIVSQNRSNLLIVKIKKFYGDFLNYCLIQK